MKELTREEFEGILAEEFTRPDGGVDTEELDEARERVERWVRRGDGAAVYENQDLGHRDIGAKKIVSFGSGEAQLEVPEPPERLPDIGGEINWRYCLVGTYRSGA